MRLHQQEEQATSHPKSSDEHGTGPNVETQTSWQAVMRASMPLLAASARKG
jgi:hypothetical protein